MCKEVTFDVSSVFFGNLVRIISGHLRECPAVTIFSKLRDLKDWFDTFFFPLWEIFTG